MSRKPEYPTGFPTLQFRVLPKGYGDNMGRKIDLTGQRFGRLFVVEEYGRQNGHVTWLCQCDCGKKTITCTGDLRKGKTTSCGCFHNEMVSNLTRSHSKCGTRLYAIYSNMRQRCLNEDNRAYKWYGGRGISICLEWLDSFQKFYEWAIENGYSDKLTLDRIDSDGNYEPSNCRWVTIKEQQNNKRSNHLFTYNGETHNLREWSELTGINYGTLKNRLCRYGWTTERAFNTK